MIEGGKNKADAHDLEVEIAGESIEEPVSSRSPSGDKRHAAASRFQLVEELVAGLGPGRLIRNNH